MNINMTYFSECGNYKIEVFKEGIHCSIPDNTKNCLLVIDTPELFLSDIDFNVKDVTKFITYPKKPSFTTLVDRGIFLDVEDPEQFANDYLKKWYENKPKDFSNYYIYPVELGKIENTYVLAESSSLKTSGYILILKDFVESEKNAQVFKNNLLKSWNKWFNNKTYNYRLYKIEKSYFVDDTTLENLISSGHEFDRKTIEKYFKVKSSVSILRAGVLDEQTKEDLTKNFNFQLNYLIQDES